MQQPRSSTGAILAIEWIADAAERIGSAAPHLSMTEVRHLAGDLYSAWPLLSPQEAVACYFGDGAPANCADVDVIELIYAVIGSQ